MTQRVPDSAGRDSTVNSISIIKHENPIPYINKQPIRINRNNNIFVYVYEIAYFCV
ncbi:MAG: hypothetical protein IT281_01725 [Ignavibacteria bacterium]|nr:hypothetical protein [Ignavibacteria bacterium]